MKLTKITRLIALGLVILLVSGQTVCAEDLGSELNTPVITENQEQDGDLGEVDDVDDEVLSSNHDDEVQDEEDLQEETAQTEGELLDASSLYTLQYRVHVQTNGWQDWVSDGEMAGTIGQKKRVEAIQIRVVDKDGNPTDKVHVEYQVHVQSYGWQDWVSDGEVAGTTGQAKRLEAIKIRLTGDDGTKCKIQYQAHVQTYGWQETVLGDAMAGTEGQAKRLEAIIISLNDIVDPVIPGDEEEEDPVNEKVSISYSGHIQTYGDVPAVSDGERLGTVGEAKRMEGITINLIQPSTGDVSGHVEYSAYVQSQGWTVPVTEGTYCGTKGERKQLEAVAINLTDDLAAQYDIYYRVHVQTYGWLGWAKDGDPAGTEGYSKRMEAIEIRLVADGEPAPEMGEKSFISNSEEENPTEEKVEQIKTYVNVPYVWGGNTPAGWDCSGCVQWIYKNIFGITMPRTSYDQAKVGTAVSLTDSTQWQVGDLLCFAGTSGVSHTGLYIGNGQMIHALNETYGTEIRNVWEYDAWDTGLTLVAVKRVL